MGGLSVGGSTDTQITMRVRVAVFAAALIILMLVFHPFDSSPSDAVLDDVEQWRSLVADVFPARYVDDVLAVMWCESKGDPSIVNRDGEFSVGLMQINTEDGMHGWLNGWGDPAHALRAEVKGIMDWRDLLDPRLNLEAAKRISQGGWDWAHWTCQP